MSTKEILTKENWPYPKDTKLPDDEEFKVFAAMQQAIQDKPELVEELNAEQNKAAFLMRFARGYYFNQFKKLPVAEKTAKTVLIFQRCLQWRHQNQVSTIHRKDLPRRQEFDRTWISGVSGVAPGGRPCYVVHPPGPKLMSGFTKEEVIWLHWQENEWLMELKAHNSRRSQQAVLDHHVLMDFGDGTKVKCPGISISTLKWFKEALKWEPPDMKEGEDAMDVDGYCYPESLYRTYMINTGFTMRTLWSIGKLFLYETTREKFRVLGSDMKANRKVMTDDGLPLSCLPLYIGGTGLNPPGLVLHQALKKATPLSIEVPVPAEHDIYFRFTAKYAVSVLGTYSGADGAEVKGQEVCSLSVVGGKWQEGTREDSQGAGVLHFVFTAASSTTVQYEVTVRPRIRGYVPAAELETFE